MVWERIIQFHPLPGAGPPSTRPGYSKPLSSLDKGIPGVEIPQFLWKCCAGVFPPTEVKESRLGVCVFQDHVELAVTSPLFLHLLLILTHPSPASLPRKTWQA